MNKFFKISGVVAAIVAVLVIALIALAKILVTPERIRATVLPKAKAALHRDISLGDVEVSLFSGITLKDLVVREPSEDEPFIAADRVVLRYRLWPLLFMRVVIDEVRLDAPRVRVERLADGRFNFSDLMGPAAGSEERPAALEGAADKKGESIDLLVSEVVLSGGEVIFLDHGLGTETPYRYRLTGLEADARGISLVRKFPFRVKAQFNHTALEVEGEADPGTRWGRAKVLLSDLDVTPFVPYFRQRIPGRLGSLKVALDLTAEGGAQALESKGRIAMREIDLVLDAMKDVPIRGADLALDYAVKVDLAASRVDIEKTTVAFNGIPLQLAGRLENYVTEPAVDLTAEIKNLDIQAALAAAPPALAKPAADLGPAGMLQARIHLAGPVAEPLKLLREGEVSLDGVQANVGNLRPALSGVLNLRNDSLRAEKLLLRIGENVAAIDLQGSNLFGKPVIVGTQVTAERFLLDPLLKTAAAPAASAGQTGEQVSGSAEIGPLDLPVKADGSVKVGQVLYHGLPIEDFELSYRLENNILNVDKMTGKVAGGRFNQTARVDLGKKGLGYASKVQLAGIQADPLVSALLPKAAGTAFGTLNLDTEISGRGTLAEAIKKNLSGKGNLLLADGKLTGAGLVQGLANFLDLEELRVLRFSRATGSYTIDNGRISLNSDVSGSDVRMAPRGSVGLDGALDLTLGIRLSPELTRKLDGKGKVTRFLTDAEGWGQLPLRVAGTAGSPRFSLDAAALKGTVKEKAREEIRKKLQEKIFDKLAPAEGEEEGTEEPAKKLLEDTLKGLFGN
jgi:AsmA protein